MALPPFPSQEVAKLVLGYLAEEHLMTAYDEFLQASPYLDAFRNEYGRVFMTSLKNILAEYMAVKIYVESCKPIFLRKKLMQCANLLEVVKLLVALVDVQKANFQDSEKSRIYKPNVISKGNSCDDCGSYYANCSCHTSFAKNQVSSETEVITENSVEATSLADLPGNAVIQEDIQKNVCSVEYNVHRCQLNSSENNFIQCADSEPSNQVESNINSVTSSTTENSNDVRTMPEPGLLTMKPDASRKNIEEFETILDIVAEQNANSNVTPSKTILNTGTFQEFADGVGGTRKDKEFSSDTPKYPPDALIYQNNANCIANMDGSTRQLTTAPPPGYAYNTEDQYHTSRTNTSTLKEKYPEQKIKIISDIQVNNCYTKMPPILKSTSSPLVQMQTLYINGTPAYKNKMQTGSNYSYTKDEIMAMPTIIIVPASGTSKNPQIVLPRTTTATKKQNVDTITTNSTKSVQVLKPLTIDVQTSSSVSDKSKENKDMNLKDIENTNEKGLVKTVDMTTVSLPKDASGTSLSKTSTPTVLPPMKKSSSTPRRTSHIRVLDFTTPRRILNENSSDTNVNDSNIPSKTLPDVIEEQKERSIDDNPHTNFRIPHKNSQVDKPLEKKIKPKKKSNWDADLRALLVPSDPNKSEITKKTSEESKNISKNCLKNKDKSINKSKLTNSIKNRKEKSTPLSKRTKKKIKPEKKTVDSNLATIKPTINIITTNNETPPLENNNKQCQINNDTEQSDTPEAERLALQNVIGAKLNISDLLETPYKQAIYDIQMETPRFLGPDLPDEPMSDIKIMNIPTPRFFDTPKITQATPSSYSSRQTDYSSGGSYYKPDDQDYIPIAEVLECAIRIERMDSENSLGEVHERSKRPVRKCTKNVSYRRSSNHNNKVKEEIKPHRNSISNDDNGSCVLDKKTNKKISRATPNRKTKPKESSLVSESSRKDTKVSPLKIETQKHFMKIKPRKTPMKEYSAKRNRKLSDSSKQLFYNETQSKKRMIKDTKTASAATAIALAPTKSRRKSASPRKLQFTKSFNSDSGEHNLPDLSKSKEDVFKDSKVLYPQDSDTEQPPLRWSDDGSQEDKSKDIRRISHPQNEEDDIDNIKKYIENCSKSDNNKDSQNNKDSNFDLKRTFDAETAKIIERDLLDTPPRLTQPPVMEIVGIENKQVTEVTVSNNSESANIDNDECDENEEQEEVELSVCDCNEDSKNYFSYTYDETKFTPKNDLAKLKDKFCMELCMEDGISIRLNATTISTMFEQDPGDFAVDECYFNETVTAVSSISNIERLYTPMKDVRNQCIEIFDSTLTSLDTPLKVNSPKERQQDAPLTELVLEIENIQCKENTDTKRRKRNQSCVVEESVQSTKKLKSETQELLKSANIQNMDIESVLSKLHGP